MLSSRVLAAAALSAIAVAAHAQTAPAPVMRVTFADAIQRAQEKNPTVAGAAAGILRADALVRQARVATLFQLSGNVTTTTLNEAVEFAGQTVTPRSQIGASLTASMPIVAAAAWARKTQALDARAIADLTVAAAAVPHRREIVRRAAGCRRPDPARQLEGPVADCRRALSAVDRLPVAAVSPAEYLAVHHADDDSALRRRAARRGEEPAPGGCRADARRARGRHDARERGGACGA